MTNNSPSALFNQAYRYVQNRQFSHAEKILIELTRLSPPKEQVWQLLVSCAFNQKKYSEALNWLVDSTNKFSNKAWQKDVEIKLYRALGDTAKEYALLEASMLGNEKKAPWEVWQRLTFLAIKLEKFSAAKDYFAQCLRVLAKHTPQYYQFNRDYYRQIEQYDKALQYSEKALSANSQDVNTLHEHAVLLRLNGLAEKALSILQPISEQQSHFAIYHNLANAQSDLGLLEDAVENYSKAIRFNPNFIESHVNLSRIKWQLNHKESFLDSFKSAGLLTTATGFFAYADSLLKAKKFELLRQELDEYRHFSTLEYWHELLAASYRNDGDFAQAETVYQHIEKTFAPSIKAQLEHSINQIETGQYREAYGRLSGLQEQVPDNQLIKAYWHTAARLAKGEGFAVDKLYLKQPLFPQLTLKQRQRLVDELAPVLRSLHSSVSQPINQTLEQGTQTQGHLFASTHPMIQRLKEAVDQAILRFISEQHMDKQRLIKDDGTPNYVGSWSVRLKGKGFHHNHIHAHGRISGVVYISLPDIVNDENKKQGWLTLGQPYGYGDMTLEPDVMIKPDIFHCVLFRSFLWHGTTPFEDDAERLTVAFDVGEYGKIPN
ncbi:putative 2OG-Fe(II) oxygenase [Alteromonas sp. C1M14]|uniref:putative 2OG-Fe(II) oxygenase n=1 Tax=Alteromonas sp. C1M14 TaxID=2841567 RepID=UPI001C08CA43|nr:putative 2OG-Fe(II) oxygenase [Alteromonas sp. C1M14]MBU2978027.1 hypothetical protein [Alteromonas sp. C1M14]